MEQTDSYLRIFPPGLLKTYVFAEVRNASAALAGTNPVELADIIDVLQAFRLTVNMLTDPGKAKGEIARTLDEAFRQKGWREAGHRSDTVLTFTLEPYRKAGERKPSVREYNFHSEGHKVDNVRGRVALDVEWNAKDGNLDRDLANFRALHDAAVIDVGVLITRHHERTHWAANLLAERANVIRHNSAGQRIVLLGTTTTTNLEKVVPRLERGDGGGCPVLVVTLTELNYQAGPSDPTLPAFSGPLRTEGVAADDVADDEGEG